MQRAWRCDRCVWLCLDVGDILPEFGDWGALIGSAFLEAIKENTDFEGLLVTDLTSGATKSAVPPPFFALSPIPHQQAWLALQRCK